MAHARRIAASLLIASLAQPCCADSAPVIHYAPSENLEHVDVALIDGGQHVIDMAAYVLRQCNGKGRTRYAKHRGERATQGVFAPQFQQRTLPFVLRPARCPRQRANAKYQASVFNFAPTWDQFYLDLDGSRRLARARAKKRRKVLSEMYKNRAIADFGRRAASMSAKSAHSCGVGCQLFRIGFI